MSDFDELLGGGLTPVEQKLLGKKVKLGSEIASVPEIPDAPDISPAPTSVPGTFKNKIEGLVRLKPGELPVPGRHCVVWGSNYLDDIKPRAVKRTATISENAHAARMRREAELLVSLGIKDPLHRGKGRVERAEDYARWRYRGYVAGEVASL